MSAAHVRRGGAARTKPRNSAKVSVPKKIAKRLPVDHKRANKLAAIVFTAFLLAILVVVLVALDIPAKAERSAGAAIGEAGFKVNGYQIVGLSHMNRSLVDGVVTDELKRAAKGLGGTVNDLFVAGVAGGAGAYHREKGAPVDELRMAMPISQRDDRSAGGNAFSPSRLLVPVGPDPVARFGCAAFVVTRLPQTGAGPAGRARGRGHRRLWRAWRPA